MTLSTPPTALRRAGMIPDWVYTVAGGTATVASFLYLSRSGAKKKIEAAIESARKELQRSNRDLMETQAREITTLREEVAGLRQSNAAIIQLNQKYGIAIAEKDLEITDLQRQLRVKESRILELEASLHRRH
jgi:predicted RNase H-like nuclease (RuvC/YqgF family)